MGIDFYDAKFRELLLYIAQQCRDDVFFGATKLNKQLFFADFLAFRNLGQPITGADYMALEHGPGPRRLLPIRAEMICNGELAIDVRAHQDRIVALREPDKGVFTEDELAIVDDVIEELRDATADEVSKFSHRFAGWLAAMKEGNATGRHVSIPYETVFVEQVPFSPDIIARGRELAAKYDWPVQW